MSALLDLNRFRLGPKGPELTLRLEAGQIWGVFGRAGAGKTTFLRALAQGGKTSSRMLSRYGVVAMPGLKPLPRKGTPELVARQAASHGGAARAAEALAATGLWEARKSALGDLSPGQSAALEVLEVIAGHAKILILDCCFDRMDPWARASAFALLDQRRRQGAAVVVASNDAAFLLSCDVAIVWRSGQPVFAGSPLELLAGQGASRLEVSTLKSDAIRALVEPFEVGIDDCDGGLRIATREGQKLAARLLREGYGDVRAVHWREPNPAEALLALD